MSTEAALRGYELMLQSRYIDDRCLEVMAGGEVVPNYHSARGQEALYAAAGLAMGRDDYLLYNYRAFATLLGKGVTLDQLCGDLLLRITGTTQGHGGIMHVVDSDLRLVGRNGVFGSKFGIATGLGLAVQVRGESAAVLCMFGEAEGNRGTLYEAMNIAVIRQLPIVFVAENNGYAVAARTADIYCTGNMSGLVSGFPMSVESVDGNDLHATNDALEAAVGRARDGGGPSFVEAITYRMDPHTAADDDTKYRGPDDFAPWKERDPINQWSGVLIERGLEAAALDRLADSARAAVDAAMDSALDAPLPDLSGVTDFVYFNQTSSS